MSPHALAPRADAARRAPYPPPPLSQTCTDGPNGSVCGPCPSGFSAIAGGSACVDTNGCAANPKQPGSLTPCFAGVPCGDVPAAQDRSGRDFVCASCPVGYAGNGTSCGPCTLLGTIPGASFAGVTVPRAAPLSFFGAGNFPARAANGFPCASNPPGGITFSWSAEPRPLSPDAPISAAGASVPEAALALLNQASLNPNLQIPARVLPTRTSWTFTLRTCYAGSRSAALCGFASRNVTIASSPLVPVVSGGNAIVSVGGGPFTLDASGSFDPDGEPGGLSFSWACEKTRPAAEEVGGAAAAATECLQPDDAGPATAGLGPGGRPQLTLLLAGARDPARANYTLRLRVAKAGGQRSATATVWVAVSDSRVVLPRISLRVSPAVGARVNPSRKIAVAATTSSSNPQSLTTAWSVVSPPALAGAAFLASAAATPLTDTPTLVLSPNTLPPGSEVVVRLTATDSEGTSFADMPLSVSSAPRDGGIVVSPPAGGALRTSFNLTAVRWTRASTDLPLEYSFLYQVVGLPATATGAGGGFVTASPFSFSPTLVTQLPAGLAEGGYLVNCTVLVRNAAGVVSALPGPAQAVSVSWDDGLLADGARVSDISSALSGQAGALATTGRAQAAINLLVAAGRLLSAAADNATQSGGGGGEGGGGTANATAAAERVKARAMRNLTELLTTRPAPAPPQLRK